MFSENDRISQRQMERQIVLVLLCPAFWQLAAYGASDGLPGMAGIFVGYGLLAVWCIYLVRLGGLYCRLESVMGKAGKLLLAVMYLCYLLFLGGTLLRRMAELAAAHGEGGAAGKEKLIAAVEKRLDADAPVGFLLSGGLDSSLVCSIAAKKLGKPIRTFAIGMDTDAIDLKYARQTAEYLGSEHHEIIINRDMVINSLEEVIRLLGTWDITTIRASMGMYLLCKAIHEQTDVRVLLTGEISDELFGYKYTDYAPTADAFQQESQKRIRELYMYDVLRADRCISSNSIEARVPFGDLDFVRYVMAIDPEKKLNRYGKGKYLLRKAFEGDWLPSEILWREKAAFSDAVGHSMVDDIKEYAESLYTEEEFQMRRANYSAHCMPFTKESLFYREIFEKYYHDQSRTIVGFWMPNKAWPGCNVNDPSARVLANYGASGV